jgi:hypothetical protein
LEEAGLGKMTGLKVSEIDGGGSAEMDGDVDSVEVDEMNNCSSKDRLHEITRLPYQS